MEEKYWKDQKGRNVLIHTMSNRWLTNIIRYCKSKNYPESFYKDIMEEKKRRNFKKVR